jgi:predicted HAD superfamily Cof-like phosphohydrolase
MSTFSEDIKRFNAMYGLPVNEKPKLDIGVPAAERLRAFKSILGEELDEIDEIVAAVESGAPSLEVLTMLADLLGDIQVYCASEMRKFGLPQDEVLAVIMQSNFSKLGADGKPIYDERGKVQKGPGYWKPEPKISALLAEKGQ